MGDKYACMSTRDKSERWRVPLLIVLAAILAGYLIAHRPHRVSMQEGWKLKFDARHWKLGKGEIREVYNSSAETEVYCNRSVWLGPFRIYGSVILNSSLLGTNEVRAGMVLYDSVSGNERGRVVSVERSHKFPDGSLHEAALLRAPNGVESWVSRGNLDKTLVGI